MALLAGPQIPMGATTGRRRGPLWVLAIITSTLSLVGGTQSALADDAESTLDAVVIVGETYSEALESLAAQREALGEASRVLGSSTAQIPDLESAVRQITTSVPVLEEQLQRVLVLRRSAEADVDKMAALRYVHSASDTSDLSLFADPTRFASDRRERTLLEAAEATRRSRLRFATSLEEQTAAQLVLAREGLHTVTSALEHLLAQQLRASSDLVSAQRLLPDLELAASTERRLGAVAETDLSYVALEAYVITSRRQSLATPDCGLPWTILAAIGRIESGHGTHGQTRLDLAGNTEAEIVGIALDGEHQTQLILDTDGGFLDGDPIFDRAVGPMQFIPTTWAIFGVDGDGDGVADPHNLYDAAAAAGMYLCRAGNFESVGSARRAIWAYNHSEAYVDAVLAQAMRYEDLHIVDSSTNGEAAATPAS